MKLSDLDEYLKSKVGINIMIAKKLHTLRYTVNDSLFAMIHFTAKEQPVLTLKCRNAMLTKNREDYPGLIVPALTMEPLHWNSVYFTKQIPDEYIQRMIDDSYALMADKVDSLTIAQNGDSKVKYKNVDIAFKFGLCDSNMLKLIDSNLKKRTQQKEILSQEEQKEFLTNPDIK